MAEVPFPYGFYKSFYKCRRTCTTWGDPEAAFGELGIKKGPKGTCIETSYKCAAMLEAAGVPDVRIWHGLVMLMGVVPMEHAWISVGDTCYDMTLDNTALGTGTPFPVAIQAQCLARYGTYCYLHSPQNAGVDPFQPDGYGPDRDYWDEPHGAAAPNGLPFSDLC